MSWIWVQWNFKIQKEKGFSTDFAIVPTSTPKPDNLLGKLRREESTLWVLTPTNLRTDTRNLDCSGETWGNCCYDSSPIIWLKHNKTGCLLSHQKTRPQPDPERHTHRLWRGENTQINRYTRAGAGLTTLNSTPPYGPHTCTLSDVEKKHLLTPFCLMEHWLFMKNFKDLFTDFKDYFQGTFEVKILCPTSYYLWGMGL